MVEIQYGKGARFVLFCLKKKKRHDYESCIELLSNMNNSKSKPMHYISLKKN